MAEDTEESEASFGTVMQARIVTILAILSGIIGAGISAAVFGYSAEAVAQTITLAPVVGVGAVQLSLAYLGRRTIGAFSNKRILYMSALTVGSWFVTYTVLIQSAA